MGFAIHDVYLSLAIFIAFCYAALPPRMMMFFRWRDVDGSWKQKLADICYLLVYRYVLIYICMK